jgi:hypothetical protein
MYDIHSQMFWKGCTTTNQKRGVIICLPKKQGGHSPKDYRPITLLYTDYKVLARLVAQRLRLVLEDHLSNTQFCGVPVKSILEAVAIIRDTIAFAENKKIPMCIISLDFSKAFDRIAHEYLFKILQAYRIGTPFINGIKNVRGRHVHGANQRPPQRTHSYTRISPSRMPHEHGSVHAMPPPIPQVPGK